MMKVVVENFMKHVNFLEIVHGVDKERLRFTTRRASINFCDLVGPNERWINGVAGPRPRGRSLAAFHHSFFGLTPASD